MTMTDYCQKLLSCDSVREIKQVIKEDWLMVYELLTQNPLKIQIDIYLNIYYNK